LELGVAERGDKCNCECISCAMPLQAVNAAKAAIEIEVRPHFRHPKGAPKHSCAVLTARAAILQSFFADGTIMLPKLRRSGRVEGLSGEYHEAWVEKPREPATIASVDFQDGVTALLTLDDGRTLLVEVVGSGSGGENGTLTPTIEIVVDDPAIAALPPDEIRNRLEPLLEAGCWRGHWDDKKLTEQATAAARQQAIDALDWDTGEMGDLPAGARRETLLHYIVKEILAQRRRIRLPSLTVRAERSVNTGTVGRSADIPISIATLQSVVLERRLGRIVPDVLATSESGRMLLVEVTVTNKITNERLERIRAEGIAAVEIDIGRMGGRVTRAELEKLVIDEVAGKRWLYHPDAEAMQTKLLREIDEEISAEAERRERTSLASTDVEEWADEYLKAIDRAAEARVRIEQGYADDGTYQYYMEEANKAAKGLSAHGFPEALDSELYRDSPNIIERILSIKFDRGIGYDVGTGWQAINAILQDGPARRQRHTLYLMAIRVFKPKLKPHQHARIETWRGDVWNSLVLGEVMFVRSQRYDRLLGLLFPEMAELLAKPLVSLPPEQLPNKASEGGDWFDFFG
jgi:hypothetical protein